VKLDETVQALDGRRSRNASGVETATKRDESGRPEILVLEALQYVSEDVEILGRGVCGVERSQNSAIAVEARTGSRGQ
jgi:hypothetical protein